MEHQPGFPAPSGEVPEAPKDTAASTADPTLALLRGVADTLHTIPPAIEPILAQVTALTVPRLADLAIIYLLRDPQTLDRLTIVHRDPAKTALVAELQRRYPPDLSADVGLARVLRTGETELIPVVPQQVFAPLMRDDEQRALVSAIAPRSYLTVALQANDAILGALQLVVTESERQYGPDELAAAESLARSCGLALRSARLHSEALASGRRIEGLRELVEALNAVTTPEDVARVVSEHGALALHATTATLALCTEDAAALAIAHTVGYLPEVVAAWQPLPLTLATPLTDAARTETPVWLSTLAERRARYPHLAEAQSYTGPGALVALPLISHGQVLGALGFGFGGDQVLTPELRTLLLTVAHHCALALERARLFGAEREARVRAEAALAQRDQFLSAAAHELRTPLTSLLGNAQLLQRRALAVAAGVKEIKMLGALVSQSMRLARLINTLLTVTQLDAGELTLARTRIDLCDLARRILTELEPFAEDHTLVCEIPDEARYVLGDEARLGAMLEVLLRNAIAYSSPGSAVTLRITEDEGWITVDVVDSGQGVPPEALPHLFERWFRAPNARPANSGGLGVNLWLAREMALRHDGEIRIESEPGSGSTFSVRLPAFEE